MHMKLVSAQRRQFLLGLNELIGSCGFVLMSLFCAGLNELIGSFGFVLVSLFCPTYLCYYWIRETLPPCHAALDCIYEM